MKVSRREFLKMALATAFAATTSTSSIPINVKGQDQKKRYAMLVDVSKCYGCMACVTACASENNVPIGNFRTWVEKVVLKSGVPAFVPKLCNHCEHPSCAPACPVGAIDVREDGIVLINDEKCIGCGACVKACPYGAIFLDPVKGTSNKCTFCAHRLDKGLLPACVETCPTGARVFGDINDPNSEISKYLGSHSTDVLRPETGNDPHVFYVGLPKGVG